VIRRLVLFDIDGTLLTSAHAGRRALRSAFAAEYQDLAFFDAVRFDGKTDPQILVELHHAAGAPDRATHTAITATLDRYVIHLEREVAERANLVQPCPGIPELLDALEARDDVMIGLLTGNIVPGAKLKLGAAGIDFDRFVVGAFGSDSAHRPDLPAIAAERARSQFGHIPNGEEVVIVGDTPADVTCGLGIGARSVAVATGSYSVEELRTAGATAAFATLADTAAVVASIIA
jgi:phosphoglycolate phosphatase-like HAD superfamily hydrolase